MQAPMTHSKWPRYTPSNLSVKKLIVNLQEYIEMRLKDQQVVEETSGILNHELK